MTQPKHKPQKSIAVAIAEDPTAPPTKTTVVVRSMQEVRADAAIRPTVNAASVISDYAAKTYGDPDLSQVMDQLNKSTKQMWEGDITRIESMLFSQAHALQSMFTNLALRANRQDAISNMDVLMRMALKAQNQCRMTLESLATIKNPPPVLFARQANIAHGPQQVNSIIKAEPGQLRARQRYRDRTCERKSILVKRTNGEEE